MGENAKNIPPDINRKNNGVISEVAEILANGILRMKKKGKLKSNPQNQ